MLEQGGETEWCENKTTSGNPHTCYLLLFHITMEKNESFIHVKYGDGEGEDFEKKNKKEPRGRSTKEKVIIMYEKRRGLAE